MTSIEIIRLILCLNQIIYYFWLFPRTSGLEFAV